MPTCATFTTEYSSGLLHGGYGALGFFIGLIVGFIPFFICFWIFCFYRRFKLRSYDMACLANLHSDQGENCCYEQFKRLNCLEDPKADKLTKDDNVEANASPDYLKGSKHGRKKKRGLESLDHTNILVELKLVDASVNFNVDRDEQAMIDAITQTTEAGGELELARQDLRAAQQTVLQLWRNRLIAFTGLCGVLLNLMLADGLLDDKKRSELRQNQTNRLKDAKAKLDAEFKERRDAVNANQKLSTEEKQAATDAIDAEYGPRLGEQLKVEMANFERDLRRIESLQPQDADRLLASLKEGQARLEARLAEQRTRSQEKLAEKIAKRRQQLIDQKAADEDVAYDLEPRLDAKRAQLAELVSDKRLSESQAQQLLADYRKDLLRQKEAFEKSYLEQQGALKERLKEARRKKLLAAEAEAAQLQARLASRVDAGTITDPDAFVEEFDHALTAGEQQKEGALDELDDKDCHELDGLRSQLAQEKDATEAVIDEKAAKALGLPSDELERLLADHRSRTDRFRREKRHDKKRQARQLEEKLAQRQARLMESVDNQEAELARVKKGQELILKKALVFQVDLDDNTKKQILEEHDRNMQAMANNIQLSRQKQEMSLEAKLAARRANAAKLKKDARDARLALDDRSKSELDKLDSELARQLDDNAKKMEAESRDALQKLRDQLARETEEALRAQEESMSRVIGRLQTGRARRRGVLTAQERVLRDLESQLEAKLDGRARGADTQGLDQVLQNYDNQVATLARQMDHERRQQEKQLAEAMQRRKLDKRDEVQDNVDDEEKRAKRALLASGHGRMASFVMESVLDTKYRNSMMEMNEEVRLEMRKEQEVLDREMEEELQAELEAQRQTLFSKLTALTDLSQSEIKEMVEKAGRTAGMDRRLTRKMSRDIMSVVEESRGSFRSRPKSSRYSRGLDRDLD